MFEKSLRQQRWRQWSRHTALTHPTATPDPPTVTPHPPPQVSEQLSPRIESQCPLFSLPTDQVPTTPNQGGSQPPDLQPLLRFSASKGCYGGSDSFSHFADEILEPRCSYGPFLQYFSVKSHPPFLVLFLTHYHLRIFESWEGETLGPQLPIANLLKKRSPFPK